MQNRTIVSFAIAALAVIAIALSADACSSYPIPPPPPPPSPPPPSPPPPPPSPPPSPPPPSPPPPSPPPPSPPPSPPPPSPPPPPQNGNVVNASNLFDSRSFVVTPGIVLCAVESTSAADPYGCYAKLPATIYVDMHMFAVDNPENCACGVSMNHAPNTNVNPPGLVTSQKFKYTGADVLRVQFVVYDLVYGTVLRVINQFNLNPSINTKDYVANLLADSNSALRTLAGFYGHINDFNPADWIQNATREVTFISFVTVVTYVEDSGNIYACNENAQPGLRLGVPSCYAQGLLDPNYPYPNSHPFRVFQKVQTPSYTYQVAAGTTTPNGDGPFGDHTIQWFNNTYSGPHCDTSNDCYPVGYHCDFSTNTCQQCITDADCSSRSVRNSLGQVIIKSTCEVSKNHRTCMFPAQNYPGGNPPDAIVNCPTKCDGQFCVEGVCVDCRDSGDCTLSYSPSSSYAKTCNSTYSSSNKLTNKQCVFTFLPPAQGKNKNLALIIGVSTAVGAVVLIAAIVGVVVAYKKFKASDRYLQKKSAENKSMDSSLTTSPIFEPQSTKKSNPLFQG